MSALHSSAANIGGSPVEIKQDVGSLGVALLLSALFLIAVALPLRFRVQLPLNFMCAAMVLTALLVDGMSTNSSTAAAGMRPRLAAWLRPALLMMLGGFVAPSVCQFAIEQTSRRSFVKAFD